MSQMTVRNIPDAQYEALKQVAAENNRSAEAEVRMAIAHLVRNKTGDGFGSKLKAKYSGALDSKYRFDRNKDETGPMVFE